MLDASLTHSSSASCDDDDGGGGSSLTVGVGVDDDATAEAVVSGVTGRDVSSVAFDVSGVTADVAALPDFCLVRDDRGKSGSDSDSSPETTGELDREAAVAPLPRRDFRLAGNARGEKRIRSTPSP